MGVRYVLGIVKQAQIDSGCMTREDHEVDSAAVPGRAQGVGAPGLDVHGVLRFEGHAAAWRLEQTFDFAESRIQQRIVSHCRLERFGDTLSGLSTSSQAVFKSVNSRTRPVLHEVQTKPVIR